MAINQQNKKGSLIKRTKDYITDHSNSTRKAMAQSKQAFLNDKEPDNSKGQLKMLLIVLIVLGALAGIFEILK